MALVVKFATTCLVRGTRREEGKEKAARKG